jgi:hypothetical protein
MLDVKSRMQEGSRKEAERKQKGSTGRKPRR